MELNTLLAQVCDAVRSRITTISPISDVQLLTMSMLAGCNEAEDLLEFVASRNAYTELKNQIPQLCLLLSERTSLFMAKNGTSDTAAVASSAAFRPVAAQMQERLTCTLQETEQKSRWKHPLPRLLCYICMHSKADVEEKMSVVLGSVVRTDVRKLEDLRSSFEQEGSNLMLLASAARAAAMSLGLN